MRFYGVIAAETLMFLGSLLEVRSYHKQLVDIKQKNSIKGVSFDFVLLNLVDFITSILLQLSFSCSRHVELLYQLRNPIHPEIKTSRFLALIDAIKLVQALGLMIQIMKLSDTRKRDQSFSGTVKVFLSVHIIVASFVGWNIWNGNHYSLNYLDLLEVTWVCNQSFKICKMLPQLFMNFTNSCYPLHLDFATSQLMCYTLLIFGKVLSFIYYNWFSIPLNFYTTPCVIINFCYSIILLSQFTHYHPKDRLQRAHQN